MPAPSPLAIATSSLKRLVKEEASYDLEEKKQLADIKKLGASNNEEDENAEYQLKQLKKALQETKDIFPAARARTADAMTKLRTELEAANKDEQAKPEELRKAKEALGEAELRVKDVDYGVGTKDASNPS